MDTLIGRKIQDNDPRMADRTGTIVNENGLRVSVQWDKTRRTTHVDRSKIGRVSRGGYRFIDEPKE